MPSRETYNLLGLTKQIIAYLVGLAEAAGIPASELEGTTIQLTKNLESKMHKDKYNRGASFITTLSPPGTAGGQTFIEDPAGDHVHRLSEDIAGIGKAGDSIRGRAEQSRKQLVRFDGNLCRHCTMPFEGERYAVILFSLGVAYHETPASVRSFLECLGFRMPDPLEGSPFTEASSSEARHLAQRAASGEQVEDEAGRHKPPRGGVKHLAQSAASGEDKAGRHEPPRGVKVKEEVPKEPSLEVKVPKQAKLQDLFRRQSLGSEKRQLSVDQPAAKKVCLATAQRTAIVVEDSPEKLQADPHVAWNEDDDNHLRRLKVSSRMSFAKISQKMGRTEDSIKRRWKEIQPVDRKLAKL